MRRIIKKISSIPKLFHGSEPPSVSEQSINEYSFLYTQSDAAKKELMRRRNLFGLDDRHFDPLANLPPFLLREFSKPRAVLFRQVATPTHETIHFLKQAKKMNLKPLIFEYFGDKFVSTGNFYKRSLGKLPIFQYTGIDGRAMHQSKTVLDFNSQTGKKFSEVTLYTGESLINFHHKLFYNMTGIYTQECCVDATPWFESLGGHAVQYYRPFLSLFIRDGILFESFLTEGAEKELTQNIVAPSFKFVETLEDAKPLIIRLPETRDSTSTFWDCYPKKIEKYIQ